MATGPEFDLRGMFIALLWIVPVGFCHTLWIIFRTEKGRALPRKIKAVAIIIPAVFLPCALFYVTFINKEPKRPHGPTLSSSFEGIWRRTDEGQPRWWIISRPWAVEYEVDAYGKCVRNVATVLDGDHLSLGDGALRAIQLRRGDFGTLILETAGDRATYLMEGRDTICLRQDGGYYDSAPYPRKKSL
jgi:hypothetical protein